LAINATHFDSFWHLCDVHGQRIIPRCQLLAEPLGGIKIHKEGLPTTFIGGTMLSFIIHL
jgi:hypothetical protein